jgi:hypothetical protein
MSPKPFEFGNRRIQYVPQRQLNEELRKIVGREKATGNRIVMALHAGKNEANYCTNNGINAFVGLWRYQKDTQRLYKNHTESRRFASAKTPSLDDLCHYVLNRNPNF